MSKDTLESLLQSPTEQSNELAASASYSVDPYLFDFKRELGNIGDFVTFRILGTDKRYINTLPAIKVDKLNTKTKDVYKDQIVILPEGNDWQNMKDVFGKNLTECRSTEIKRVVVFVQTKQAAKKGDKSVLIDVNKLMYMDLPQNMIIAYNNLNQRAEGAYPFNPESNMPDYDIKISAIMGSNKIKNYAMYALTSDMSADDIPQAHKNFKKTAIEILRPHAEQFKADLPEVQKSLSTKPTLKQFLFSIGSREATSSNTPISEAVKEATTLDDIL
jgi:hypothetical protein